MEWSETLKNSLVVGFEIHVSRTEFSVSRLQSPFGQPERQSRGHYTMAHATCGVVRLKPRNSGCAHL